MKRCYVLIFTLSISTAAAQQCPATGSADMIAQYPGSALSYPMTSDQYAVQYSLDGGAWTGERVYISIYGGTNASPYEPFTSYLPFTNYPSRPTTSMSFVSIPVLPGALVQLKVTKLGNGPFSASDRVAVRPTPKFVFAQLQGDGSVQLSAYTAPNFAGEQFVLWWERDSQYGAAQQGLAFFLNPLYSAPSGPTVKRIYSNSDLADLTGIDTLDFEGFIPLTGTGVDITEGPGAQEYLVPTNINTVFLGQGAWVQGKLRFLQSGYGNIRRIYGPGVIDSSRFVYKWRQCRNSTTHPDHHPDGHQTVSFEGNPAVSDRLFLDGIVISDSDYASTTNLLASIINNVKVIGWNGNNDGLQMGDGAIAANVFVRTGDDSLELWGQNITVTNATVWQNNSGGVVNLGWDNKFAGDGNMIDGLFVVRTDWTQPSATPPWNVTTLDNQDNGVFVSLMTPGTSYGQRQPPVYRNIFVEEPPNVLFSLKILPPDCGLQGLKDGVCPAVDLTLPANVSLTIENLFSPQSLIGNSIGFQTLPSGFSYDFPAGVTHTLSADYPLHGLLNINLTNVFIRKPDGMVLPLTAVDAESVGLISSHGNIVNINYDLTVGVRLAQ